MAEVLTMANDWEEKFRAELREAFEARPGSPRSVPDEPHRTHSPLLTKWQQLGYERLNQSYLDFSKEIDDLRSTVSVGLEYSGIGLDGLVECFEWVDAAGAALHRLPALLVLRAVLGHDLF